MYGLALYRAYEVASIEHIFVGTTNVYLRKRLLGE